MTDRIVVYTSVVGQYDTLRGFVLRDRATCDHFHHSDVQYICFSDQPTPPCYPWKIQPCYMPFASSARNARLPKLLPHLHFEADYSIWIDANFALVKSPEYLIDRYLMMHADVAMFRHPVRSTVEQEAAKLIDEGLADAEQVKAQRGRWRSAGSPPGLWAAGVIIRRHTPEVDKFNEAWWEEFRLGSERDQMALPLAVHRTKPRIATIDCNVYSNDLVTHRQHKRWNETEWIERRRRLMEISGNGK